VVGGGGQRSHGGNREGGVARKGWELLGSPFSSVFELVQVVYYIQCHTACPQRELRKKQWKYWEKNQPEPKEDRLRVLSDVGHKWTRGLNFFGLTGLETWGRVKGVWPMPSGRRKQCHTNETRTMGGRPKKDSFGGGKREGKKYTRVKAAADVWVSDQLLK